MLVLADMTSQEALRNALEEKFGLRNLRSDWFRRQTAFSADVLAGPICRTDICELTDGTLPWNILEAHSVQLGTKVLVQIEDVINVANSDPRSADAPRVLQFTLTDGSIDFVAVELEPLSSRISMRTVPGTKLVLHSTTLVRRGRVMLTENDYTFLGSPPSNIWGDDYSTRVSQALVAARLQNPNMSSFDSIAPGPASGADTTASANAPLRNLPDMGGIADAVPGESSGDSDDEEFWAQAAAMADQNEAPSAQVPHPGAAHGSENLSLERNGTIMPRQAEIHRTHTTSGENGNGLASQPPPSRRPVLEQEPIVLDDIPDESEINGIPEMPVCESDPVILDCVPHSIKGSDSDDLWVDVDADEPVQIPELPVSQFDQLENLRRSGRQSSMYRAYVAKPRSKLKINPETNQLTLSALFDDGSSMVSIQLPRKVLENLSGVALQPHDGTYSSNSTSEDSSQGSRQEKVRRSCRQISGFVELEHFPTLLVRRVLGQPPEGMVSLSAKTQ